MPFDVKRRRASVSVTDAKDTRFIEPKKQFYPIKLYKKRFGHPKQAAKKKHEAHTTASGGLGRVMPPTNGVVDASATPPIF